MRRLNRNVARVAQWLIAAVVIGFAGRELGRQWRDVGPALAGVRLNWVAIAASGLIVIATYLLLIEAWRATLRVWNESLPFGTAARIWFVSNLGKYVPGKVWQIAAMGAMAQRSGISPAAAVGSSLIVNLVSIVAGFAVIAATGAERIGAALGATGSGAASDRSVRLIVIGIAVCGGVALVLAPFAVPRVAAMAGRLLGRTVVIPRVPPRAIWVAAASTTAAWILYGVAFALFTRGVAPRAAGTWSAYVAVYTGSYLAGYLALFAPGGVGVREAALVLAMPRFALASAADAAVIAVASRLWLTVLEILPGLLLMRRARASVRAGLDHSKG